MLSPVNRTATGNIGVVSIDNPPVNALSQAVGLVDLLVGALVDEGRKILDEGIAGPTKPGARTTPEQKSGAGHNLRPTPYDWVCRNRYN
jgi:hypothetical protein